MQFFQIKILLLAYENDVVVFFCYYGQPHLLQYSWFTSHSQNLTSDIWNGYKPMYLSWRSLTNIDSFPHFDRPLLLLLSLFPCPCIPPQYITTYLLPLLLTAVISDWRRNSSPLLLPLHSSRIRIRITTRWDRVGFWLLWYEGGHIRLSFSRWEKIESFLDEELYVCEVR